MIYDFYLAVAAKASGKSLVPRLDLCRDVARTAGW
jgi:hypothetical protein